MKTLYEILEVSENASKEVIEKAYKVLAKRYHPDLQDEKNKKNAEENMKKINEAFEILMDDQKREQYDNELKIDRENRIKEEIERKIKDSNKNVVYKREKEEFDPICKKYNMDLISLIAPTSHERITKIARDANGFVYCVSSLGVTGVRSEITTDIGAMVQLVKKAKNIPTAIGFGISTPEQAKKMAQFADGVIVGSAIVKLCEQYKENCIEPVSNYVKSMKRAIS